MTKEEQINIIGWGKLPCLHCGEVFDIDKEFHFCRVKEFEWLNKQKNAVLILPNGKAFNLKNKELK